MTMQDSFGISVAGVIEEIQVRLYNPDTRLAMIKVPRDTEVNSEPIVAAVISTNGSARTVKLAALRGIQCYFKLELLLPALTEVQVQLIRKN